MGANINGNNRLSQARSSLQSESETFDNYDDEEVSDDEIALGSSAMATLPTLLKMRNLAEKL